HDDDRLGRDALDVLADVADDLGVGVEQVVAAHPRLSRDPGGDDEDPGPGGLLVAVGADHAAVEALHRRGLPLVEPLPLRDPLDDVDEHDLTGELLLREALGGGGADISRADYADLVHWMSIREF